MNTERRKQHSEQLERTRDEFKSIQKRQNLAFERHNSHDMDILISQRVEEDRK